MAIALGDVEGYEAATAVRLVTAHRSGDPDAFAEIVRLHRPVLLAYARRHLPNREDAEDAVQETLLRAFRGLGRFGGGEDWRLGAWLMRICANVCASSTRHRIATMRMVHRSMQVHPSAADERGVPEEAVDPFALGAVRQALDSLPANQRHALLLRTVADLPYPEVAEELRITEVNARARVARARNTLRKALANAGSTPAALAGVPLVASSSLRGLFRRLLAAGSGRLPATASTPIARSGAVAGASPIAASSSTLSSLTPGLQVVGQVIGSPVAQAAIVASSATPGKGSLVLGLVASLATAGGLVTPAVAVSPPAAKSTGQLPAGGTVQGVGSPAEAITAASQSGRRPPGTTEIPSAVSGGGAATGASAPVAPEWVSTAASAAAVALASSTTPAPPASLSTASGSSPATPSTGIPAIVPPGGQCDEVPGFTGVTAPTAMPPLASSGIQALISTQPTSTTSTDGTTELAADASLPAGAVTPAAVELSVVSCMSHDDSLLAVDLSGPAGAAVQLLGSLVSTGPAASGASGGSRTGAAGTSTGGTAASTGGTGTSTGGTGTSTGGTVTSTGGTGTSTGGTGTTLFLFRGVAQPIGTATAPGAMPFGLSPDFVAEVQLTASAGTEALTIAFVRPASKTGASAAGRTAASGTPTAATAASGTPTGGTATGGATTGAAASKTAVATTGAARAVAPPGVPASTPSATAAPAAVTPGAPA